MNKLTVYFRAPLMTASGYGVHSRQIMDYLLSDDRFIVFAESVNWGGCGFVHESNFLEKEKLQKYYECIARFDKFKNQIQIYDLCIHCTIPNEFTRKGQLNILCTAGLETDRISNEWVDKCNEADIIVVPSKHSAKIISGTVYTLQDKQNGQIRENRVNKPIVIINEWFDKPKDIKQLDLNLDTEKNLLFIGLWGTKGGFWEDRKNVSGLVKTFIETFKDNSRVGLILKTQLLNGCTEDRLNTIKRLNEIKANFKDVKCKIHLLHEELSEEEMWGLYTHPKVTGFISLTAGEGFGLPLLEASSVGLPVLATNWSGHLDFLREKNGFIPLEYNLIDIPECQHWGSILEKGMKWARVDERDARKRMKKFIDSSLVIRRQAHENIKWLDENFSKEAIMTKWKEFFDKLISAESPANDSFDTSFKQRNPLANLVEESNKKKVLYVMPQSAGDCLMSTAIIDSLIKSRHWDTDHDFYVATSEPFKQIFDKLVEDYGVKVIDYKNEMFSADTTKEIWDYVYTPGVNVQFVFSNWLMGNGEYSLRLLEELAKNCNLSPGEITNYCVNLKPCELPEGSYIVVAPAGVKGNAKQYKYWDDIITNIKEMVSDAKLIQVGVKDEPLLKGCLDYRGKEFAESFFIIKHAYALIGVDSFPAHAAAAMETPHLIIYGSTDAHSCAPVMLKKKVSQMAIESNVCGVAKCYKDNCQKMKDGKNCLSHISPQTVCLTFMKLLEKIEEEYRKAI